MDPDFDWDAYENGELINDGSTREKLVDAYDKTLNTVKEKEVIHWQSDRNEQTRSGGQYRI
jgi:hypothetical protein